MCLKKLCVSVLLLSLTGVCAAGSSVVPTTTLAAQKANNTSTAKTFVAQSNGNPGPANVSKLDVHSLLYSGADTKIYAHLMLWFGGSNHMNVGYNSNDAAQVHRQVNDMVSRGINGVIIDWYGPNNSIDSATKLVMAEAEKHPGFTFAIMVDQGAIKWDSCPGCSPQDALINQLQYIEQTYFPSRAYMTTQGRPVVTNFNIDLSYSVDWNAVNSALSTKPAFLFQNNDGFAHALSTGSYSWVIPTTSDYGMGYLTSFYKAGLPFTNEQTMGATYKGFNDTLASWGLNRVMGQQCGQTWLQTFSEINGLYNSGKQLPSLQLVTWNDYEEGTEIESGIGNCFTVSASASGNTLRWSIRGNENTIDHYLPYISTDGQNLMPLAQASPGTNSVNLCSYALPNGNYTAYVQAVGKPSITNQISGAVKIALKCSSRSAGTFSLGASPSSLILSAGRSGNLTLTVVPQSGSFDAEVALTCAGLPVSLSCSFSPSAVIPGEQAATSVLTVVSAKSLAASHSEKRPILLSLYLSGFGLFGLSLLGKMERKRLLTTIGAALLAGVAIGSTSCGGTSLSAVKASSPVPNSYALTVSGISGADSASTTVAITVD
jgi:hypothetical protein